MQELKLNNDIFPIPSNWNELTGDQLLAIAALAETTMPVNEFYLKALLAITGLKPVHKPEIKKNGETFFAFTKGKAKYLIDVNDITYICSNSLKFLFCETKDKQGNISMILDCKLTKNILPEIKIKGKTFYGPADALTNFIMSEYIAVQTNLSFFYKSKNENYLNRFIAVLYRPQSKHYNPKDEAYRGDRRETFNDFLTADRANIMAQLPSNYKKAILLFFEGCYNFIITKHPVMHEDSGNSSTNVFDSFMNLVNALANNDVTKKEEIRKTYLYDVLNTLEQLAIQHENSKHDL